MQPISTSRPRLFAATAVTILFAASTALAAPFTFTKIADTNTPAGGGGKFHFGVFDAPAVFGSTVAFIATSTATGKRSLWTASRDGTNKKKVLNQGAALPSSGLGRWAASAGNMVQVYQNTLVLNAVNSNGVSVGVGLYAMPVSGGALTKLVDMNTARPDDSADNFDAFPNDFDVNSNRVVFNNGGKIYKVALTGGAVTTVAAFANSATPPSPPAPYCCIFDSPTVRGTTVLLNGGNVNGRDAIQTVGVNGATFEFIATEDIRAPRTPAGYTFDPFEFQSPVIDQAAVFRGGSEAEGRPYIFGVYSTANGLTRLVDTNAPVPSGVGNFTVGNGPNFDMIAASNGVVVFRGYEASGRYGLYAVPIGGGRIAKIIRQGDTIDGRTISDIFFRRDGFQGNTLALLVSFTNFQAGIFTTRVVLP